MQFVKDRKNARIPNTEIRSSWMIKLKETCLTFISVIFKFCIVKLQDTNLSDFFSFWNLIQKILWILLVQHKHLLSPSYFPPSFSLLQECLQPLQIYEGKNSWRRNFSSILEFFLKCLYYSQEWPASLNMCLLSVRETSVWLSLKI